jgi:hypothetical protein
VISGPPSLLSVSFSRRISLNMPDASTADVLEKLKERVPSDFLDLSGSANFTLCPILSGHFGDEVCSQTLVKVFNGPIWGCLRMDRSGSRTRSASGDEACSRAPLRHQPRSLYPHNLDHRISVTNDYGDRDTSPIETTARNLSGSHRELQYRIFVPDTDNPQIEVSFTNHKLRGPCRRLRSA